MKMTKKTVYLAFFLFLIVLFVFICIIKKNTIEENILTWKLANQLKQTNDGWEPLAIKILPKGKALILNSSGMLRYEVLEDWNFAYVNISDMQNRDLNFLNSSSELTELSISIADNLKDISGVEGKKLSFLLLYAKQLTDITPIVDMPLTQLHLKSGDITDISPVGSLKSLRSLNLSCANLKDISSLKNLANLNLLWLREVNSLKDISSLKELKNLTWLEISGNELTDISSLQGLDKVKVLRLSGCGKLEDISAIKSMNGVKELYLNDTQVKDLTPLIGKPLDYLDIRNTPAAKLPIPEGVKAKAFYK